MVVRIELWGFVTRVFRVWEWWERPCHIKPNPIADARIKAKNPLIYLNVVVVS
jgi:hypothetical protein